MFTIHFTEEVGPQDYNQIIYYCIPTIYQITLLRVSVGAQYKLVYSWPYSFKIGIKVQFNLRYSLSFVTESDFEIEIVAMNVWTISLVAKILWI